jgi:hypothetical protein
MTTVIPVGYVTILQAAEMLLPATHGGLPDLLEITELRATGIDVRDGRANDRIIAEIWNAVDIGKLRPVAIGGQPRRIVRLDSNLTKEIPALRNPRGRGFSYLRAGRPAFQQLTAWFGPDLSKVVVAFREKEVGKLGQALMRTRRRKLDAEGTQKRIGRPSRLVEVERAIREVVEKGKWHPLHGVKALAKEANRFGKWDKPASDETVARALDRLFETLGDRRFQRVRKGR